MVRAPETSVAAGLGRSGRRERELAVAAGSHVQHRPARVGDGYGERECDARPAEVETATREREEVRVAVRVEVSARSAAKRGRE